MTDNAIFLKKLQFSLRWNLLWNLRFYEQKLQFVHQSPQANISQVQNQDLGWVGGWVKASNPPLCEHFIPTVLILEIHKTSEMLGFCWCWRQGTHVLHPWGHAVHASLDAEEEWVEKITPPWGSHCHISMNLLLSFSLCKMENTRRPGPPTCCCNPSVHGLQDQQAEGKDFVRTTRPVVPHF